MADQGRMSNGYLIEFPNSEEAGGDLGFFGNFVKKQNTYFYWKTNR